MRLAGKAQPYSDMLIFQMNSGNECWNCNSVSSNSYCSEQQREFTDLVNRIGCFNLTLSERKLEKISQINIENVRYYTLGCLHFSP